MEQKSQRPSEQQDSAKISLNALAEVRRALEQYERAIEKTRLKESTKQTYLVHAKDFVRWLADDFEPGSRVWKAASAKALSIFIEIWTIRYVDILGMILLELYRSTWQMHGSWIEAHWSLFAVTKKIEQCESSCETSRQLPAAILHRSLNHNSERFYVCKLKHLSKT